MASPKICWVSNIDGVSKDLLSIKYRSGLQFSEYWSQLQRFVEYPVTIASPTIPALVPLARKLLSIKYQSRLHLLSIGSLPRLQQFLDYQSNLQRVVEHRISIASLTNPRALDRASVCWVSNIDCASVCWVLDTNHASVCWVTNTPPTIPWVLDINRVSDSLSIGYQLCLLFLEYWISIVSPIPWVLIMSPK